MHGVGTYLEKHQSKQLFTNVDVSCLWRKNWGKTKLSLLTSPQKLKNIETQVKNIILMN